MNGYNQLHNYQLKAIDFILAQKKCAIYLGMGLGKTIITLSAIQRLFKDNTVAKVLIVAPLRVANNVWHTELQKWEHTKNITWSIITGTLKERIQALKTKADIYLINRENIPWLYQTGYFKWDLIVLDESSSFKNPSSKRFKTIKHFKYDYMIQLSGTPAPNSLLDLWSQIYLLDKGRRLGRAYYIYVQSFFMSDYSGYNLICRNEELIYKKISDISLSMKTEDYLELPPKILVNTKIDIGQHRLYNELKREFIANIENKEIIAINAAALTNKLFQFCNGAVYDENKNTIEIHDAKINALEEIIEENKNECILVAYNFKSDLKRLLNRFKTAIVMDKEGSQIKDWNAGKIKLLLCHPASSGKGLNLQAGGHIIVWFGLTWSLEDYLQFNSRLHRQGQSKPVIINHLIANNCMDEKIMEMLSNKEMCLNNLLEYLKKEL